MYSVELYMRVRRACMIDGMSQGLLICLIG